MKIYDLRLPGKTTSGHIVGTVVGEGEIVNVKRGVNGIDLYLDKGYRVFVSKGEVIGLLDTFDYYDNKEV